MPSFKAQDPLTKINLGTEDEPKTIKVSSLLAKGDRNWLIDLIKQYKDCFAWDNYEVPGLSLSTYCPLRKVSNPINSG